MNYLKNTIRAASVMLVAAAAFSASALTMKNPNMSLEELTKKADEIVVGNIVTEEPTVIGRSFETSYKVQINENLKSRSGQLPAGKTVTMTLPGASLTTPPLTQYVSGVPYMAKGEEVILFLRNSNAPPKAAPKNGERVSGLSSSPKIVGWNQGRFSVLTHPKTGKRLVTRINLEHYGMMNSGRDMKQVLDAAAANDLPLIEKAFMRLEDKAAEAKNKDPLEMTLSDQKQIKVEEALQKGAALGVMRQRGGIPVQSFDEFKAQIKSFSNEQN